MKKLLFLLLACMMLASSACALTQQGDQAGMILLPDGSTEETARYVFRYAYPQFVPEDEVSEMINAFYTYMVEDNIAFSVPMAYESLAEDDMQSSTHITYTITCQNESYLSIRILKETLTGASSGTVTEGHTFALTGERAGTVISLPYLLGVLVGDETDTWLQDRQTAKTDELIRRLIWSIIEQQQATAEIAYYDTLTYEDFCADFYPEEDFYLDENGNPVFFVQPSLIAPASEGTLLYPFTMDELLDEL